MLAEWLLHKHLQRLDKQRAEISRNADFILAYQQIVRDKGRASVSSPPGLAACFAAGCATELARDRLRVSWNLWRLIRLWL